MYFPFVIATIFTVILNVIMQVMLHNEGMNTLPQAASAKMMFDLGSKVIIIFSVIFTFYTHSFLIKQRKKELGLYNILGLDKKHLTIMLFIENALVYFVVMLLGLFLGMFTSKLMFLILKKMTGLGNDFVFNLTVDSIVTVMILFLVIFFSLFVYDTIEVRKTKPVELMTGGNTGEREPKNHWFLTLVGLATLFAGYTISVTIKTPLQAIALFFVAVLLVILGTYLLFITASISFLKILKRRKSFYYQPQHFISVSGMIYRMKQNGAGLATICILSTMTLVTLSSTICLYIGMENSVQNRNPFDVSIDSKIDKVQLDNLIKTTIDENKIKKVEYLSTSIYSSVAMTSEDNRSFRYTELNTRGTQGATLFQFMSLENFNQLQNESKTLTENQLLICSSDDWLERPNIFLAGREFQVKEVIGNLIIHSKNQPDIGIKSSILVFKDDEVIINFIQEHLPEVIANNSLEKKSEGFLKFKGTEMARQQFVAQLTSNLETFSVENNRLEYRISFIDDDRKDTTASIGGFLFMGIVFGFSFVVATALIIYYKQLSEGNDDRLRFEIMQKVGLSHKEVKRTIHSQILQVFFLPIIVASIHLTFAFPMIQKLLFLFGVTNKNLLIFATITVVVAFAVIYLLIYWQTSRIYYRLVERR